MGAQYHLGCRDAEDTVLPFQQLSVRVRLRERLCVACCHRPVGWRVVGVWGAALSKCWDLVWAPWGRHCAQMWPLSWASGWQMSECHLFPTPGSRSIKKGRAMRQVSRSQEPCKHCSVGIPSRVGRPSPSRAHGRSGLSRQTACPSGGRTQLPAQLRHTWRPLAHGDAPAVQAERLCGHLAATPTPSSHCWQALDAACSLSPCRICRTAELANSDLMRGVVSYI